MNDSLLFSSFIYPKLGFLVIVVILVILLSSLLYPKLGYLVIVAVDCRLCCFKVDYMIIYVNFLRLYYIIIFNNIIIISLIL